MRKKSEHKPSNSESNYVRALSRDSTVNAYANWRELTKIESLCLDNAIRRGDSILDLGCGTGRIAYTIGAKLGSYLGIDCSSEMINAAKELNPTFTFLCEDILSPSYSENNFDVILLMNNVLDMLHPIQRRNEIFILTKELLKPQGVLVASSHLLHNSDSRGYYEEDYHGVSVNTYRSTFSQLCEEFESYGYKIRIAARDYRSEKADWAYIVASF